MHNLIITRTHFEAGLEGSLREKEVARKGNANTGQFLDVRTQAKISD